MLSWESFSLYLPGISMFARRSSCTGYSAKSGGNEYRRFQPRKWLIRLTRVSRVLRRVRFAPSSRRDPSWTTWIRKTPLVRVSIMLPFEFLNRLRVVKERE